MKQYNWSYRSKNPEERRERIEASESSAPEDAPEIISAKDLLEKLIADPKNKKFGANYEGFLKDIVLEENFKERHAGKNISEIAETVEDEEVMYVDLLRKKLIRKVRNQSGIDIFFESKLFTQKEKNEFLFHLDKIKDFKHLRELFKIESYEELQSIINKDNDY